jgi:formylmethanofuran dehydrogenase subunit E
VNVRSYTVEEFIKKVEAFHGYPAPGVVLGGFMVDLVYQQLPAEGLFDAICETTKCLPDAIQLLTPCTIGNSWLRIIETGRFALTLYDKKQGEGVRVCVDPLKLDKWPEIKTWILKLKNKKEQDSQLLLKEVLDAGTSILNYQKVKVDLSLLKRDKSQVSICPVCGEGYPSSDGEICLNCRSDKQYCTITPSPDIKAEKISRC